ncbi:hypothetical protein EV122DRAFT_225758, partial [Schizophyllum commune]
FELHLSSRNDADPATHAFVASLGVTTTTAFGGRLTFNPARNALVRVLLNRSS